MNNYVKPIVAVAVIAAVTILGVALITRDSDDDDMEPVTVSSAPTAAQVDTADVADNDDGDFVDPDATNGKYVDPDDVPITGSELKRVEQAALAVTGNGTVTDIDRSDDLGEAYEVEVVTDLGEVDVALDKNLDRVANQRYED